MENRVLFDLLKEIQVTDAQMLHSNLRESIDSSAKKLGEIIRHALDLKSSIPIKELVTGFQAFNNVISLDFKLGKNENLYINIDASSMHYGFTVQLEDHEDVLKFDEALRIKRSRYFLTSTTTALCNGSTEISSDYQVTLRQLNSRDFLDYTVFVLNKAVELIEAQRSIISLPIGNVA